MSSISPSHIFPGGTFVISSTSGDTWGPIYINVDFYQVAEPNVVYLIPQDLNFVLLNGHEFQLWGG